MTEPHIMSDQFLIAVIAALWSVLNAIFGWMIALIFKKLDKLADHQSETQLAFQKAITEGDNLIHHRVNDIDRRVIRLEAKS